MCNKRNLVAHTRIWYRSSSVVFCERPFTTTVAEGAWENNFHVRLSSSGKIIT
jgi:hypothetical protein